MASLSDGSHYDAASVRVRDFTEPGVNDEPGVILEDVKELGPARVVFNGPWVSVELEDRTDVYPAQMVVSISGLKRRPTRASSLRNDG